MTREQFAHAIRAAGAVLGVTELLKFLGGDVLFIVAAAAS